MKKKDSIIFQKIVDYAFLRHVPIVTLASFIVTIGTTIAVIPHLNPLVTLNFSGPSRFVHTGYQPTYVARDDLLWIVTLIMGVFVVIELSNVLIALSKKEYDKRRNEHKKWLVSQHDPKKLEAQVTHQINRMARPSFSAAVTVIAILLSWITSFFILISLLFEVLKWNLQWTGIIVGCIQLLPFAIGGVTFLVQKKKHQRA